GNGALQPMLINIFGLGPISQDDAVDRERTPKERGDLRSIGVRGRTPRQRVRYVIGPPEEGAIEGGESPGEHRRHLPNGRIVVPERSDIVLLSDIDHFVELVTNLDRVNTLWSSNLRGD